MKETNQKFLKKYQYQITIFRTHQIIIFCIMISMIIAGICFEFNDILIETTMMIIIMLLLLYSELIEINAENTRQRLMMEYDMIGFRK